MYMYNIISHSGHCVEVCLCVSRSQQNSYKTFSVSSTSACPFIDRNSFNINHPTTFKKNSFVPHKSSYNI